MWFMNFLIGGIVWGSLDFRFEILLILKNCVFGICLVLNLVLVFWFDLGMCYEVFKMCRLGLVICFVS